MKTKITAMILFVILALMMAVSVSAEMSTSAFVSGSSVQPGQSVTVYVDLSGAPNVSAGGVSISYDASVLEFSSFSWEVSALMADFNEGENRGVFGCGSPTDVNGSLLSVTFTVRNDAPVGSTSVSCSVSLMDEQNDSLSDSAYATITVIACEHSGAQPKEEIPSSCTVPGYAAGVYCDNCDAYVSGGEQLPLADHSYGNWVNIGTEGHWHKCAICSAEETVPHDYVWTDLGTMHHGDCTVCGDGVSGDHDFSGQQVADEYKASDAECTHPATYYYSCLVCGLADDTMTFGFGDPLPHTYTEVVDDRFKVSDADCQHGTLYYKSCTCGAVDTETFEVGSPLPHSYIEVVDDRFKVSDADCEHAAIYYMSCSNCGLQGTEKFDHGTELGHAFATAYSYNATHHYHECTRDGCGVTDTPEVHEGGAASCSMLAVCTVCSQSYGTLLDHVYDQEKAEDAYLKSEANCTQAAAYYKSCICGEKGTESFSYGTELGHNFATTYSSNVNYHYYECLRDGCYVTDGRDLHTGGTASCSQNAVCEVCNHAYGSLLEHNYGDWSSLGVDEQERQCQDCGAWDYSGHYWDDGVITTPATENAPGEKSFSCYDCGQIKTVEIPMLSHTHAFGEAWKNNADQHWHECACGEKQQTAAHAWNETVTKPATCEETGVKTLSCTVCGTTKTEDIPLAEHSWDAGTVTTEATEQTTGVMTHICTVCRESKTEAIPVLEHTHTAVGAGEWSSNDTHHWIACSCGDRIGEAEHTWEDSIAVATCESKGLITYTCAICGYTKTEEIPQFEHTWNEGEITTEPTEDATGVKTYTCTSCGKATRTEDIPQLEKAEEPEQPERPGISGPFLFLIILLIGLLIILLVFFLYARKKDRYN